MRRHDHVIPEAAAYLYPQLVISGDFNGDGVRDMNDICDMVNAWKRLHGQGVERSGRRVHAGSSAYSSIDPDRRLQHRR